MREPYGQTIPTRSTALESVPSVPFPQSLRVRTSKGLDFDASLLVLPSLEESDRIRTQFDASLSMDLIADFDFKVTVYDRFDSQPPAGNVENDYGITLGLSWDN